MTLFGSLVPAWLGLGLLCLVAVGAASEQEPAITLRAGPHLFLDDRLIAQSDGLTRLVNAPRRDLPGPVVTGREDGCFQPYMTVLRDPATRRFRIWYGVPENASQSHLGYMESADGIHWKRPHRVLADPRHIQFGVSVLDAGAREADPARRYKYAWWDDGGLQIAVSADGFAWKPIAPGPVHRHNHDINNLFWDSLRRRYTANVSVYTTGSAWTGQRRVTMQTTSADLRHWSEPWYAITPDNRDEGETQFYCMGGVLARGDLLVGMVRVLRDDLPAVEGGPVAGLGYTTLAWSHDGRHWERDREPFLPRNPVPGSWDRAMSWIDCQLPVGDDLYLYYGGYARGHKVERFTERQIGLVRMRRDRYVAREAGETQGMLRTPVVSFEAREMTLNLEAPQGEARVQIVDPAGRPLPGFAFADCAPIRGDGVALPVRWKRSSRLPSGSAARLEFSLRRARLYAFDLR